LRSKATDSRIEVAMKINAKVVGYGPDPGRDQALVNVIVEFSGPTESMTLTVIVPNEGDEAAIQEKGIARAKTFALQFAALPPGQ
jgi:hypothetical protein